jgi:hypothetical protein
MNEVPYSNPCQYDAVKTKNEKRKKKKKKMMMIDSAT